MRSTTLVKLHKYKVGQPPRQVWKLVWWGLRDGVRTKFQETIGNCRDMTKRDADLLRAEKEIAIGARLLSPNKSRRMGLAEYLEYDREECIADSKPRTIETLRNAGDHAVRVLGADYSIQRVDYADVQRIKKHLASRSLSPATIGKVIHKLSAAFSRAVKLEIIPVNPFAGVKLPKWQGKAIRTFKPEEVEAMVAVAPTLWWQTFIRLAYTSGFRQGELLNLLWADVDLDNGVVCVARKKAGTFTVAGEAYPVLAWDAKDYGTRSVPLPADVVLLLSQLKAKCGGSAYVFLSLERLAAVRRYMDDHGGTLSEHYAVVNNMPRDFRLIQTEARRRLANEQGQDDYDWPQRSFHDLRRSFGTAMAQHVRIHELKDLMGHSSITTTQLYYLAVSENVADKVRAAFAAGA
jgi:integrase